ncbi:dTDP-glucose 4,6-dehydratase [Acetoanaerobium pronyense]|uniref:dTDP-glucose 4,6-dehydratase n=1 Tax=Acetoanaerobium pronyense TaxID=1482736 RepID=A0ABS4KH77_9FIRM|nr:dTDP-glucose 4,6-dehydratase [Acetoanaerobium pronyense]MBP2027134.1 dTDP-glucose 4,6-dehydratase [Acetoanaerobium pronyense]
MKKMLVTGGAGFIGSNFVKLIIEKEEYNLVNLDELTYAGNLENLKEIENHKNYKFVKGSIADSEFINELFEKENFDYVVNFAAESHVDRSISNPQIFIHTNVMGTQILLDAAKKSWQIDKDEYGYPIYKEGVKFVQVSTDEVYGTLGKTGLFTETTPIKPNSPYSASKAASDLIVRAYNETFKMPTNITRCSNNYGPYQFPEKLIPLMINNCLKDKQLPVYGDGMQIRDWLHVKDHCEAIGTVLEKGITGEVYNIGGNNEKANIEIVKLIIESLGKNETLIKYVEDRLGHDRRYAIDNTKITTELGWAPKYTFEEGIKETINWYIENSEWLSRVINKDYMEYYETMYANR